MAINRERTDINDLKRLINHSIAMLYENDNYLIQHRIHERTIVFRFGIYFYLLLQGTKYSNYDLDLEYNKNHSNPKKTVSFTNGTYPDLLLHKRGSNDYNILIMEFKIRRSRNIYKDIKKLKDFTSPNQEYKYKLGMFVLLLENRSQFTYVIDGQEQ